MKSIGIFCGSSAGEHPLYLETARLVGRTLAQQGLALVYGGGKVGLMGAVADAALEAGGVVIGVMPRGLVDTDLRTASNSSCGVAATPMVTEMPRSAAALTTPCDTDAK